MKSCVYLLISLKDGRTYLGSTDNLDRRIAEHNKGLCKSTKNRRPLKLIYKEECSTLRKARFRERYLKAKVGRNELKIIFNGLDNTRWGVAKR